MRSTKSIPVEDAVQGMTLSCNLTDQHGNVLLPENTILTEAMIGSIRRHDIAEVAVEFDSDDDQYASDQSQRMNLEEKIKRVDQLFLLHENESANLQLKQFLINFIRSGGK